MDFSWKHIEYAEKPIGDMHVLWLKPVNRYLQLKEPAFQVFKQLTDGSNESAISRNLEDLYQLSGKEAQLFVADIAQNLLSLFQDYREPDNPQLSDHVIPPEFTSHTEKCMSASGKTILLCFGDKHLLEYLFPLFNYLEIPHPDPPNFDLQLEFQKHQEKAYLRINKGKVYAWPFDQLHRLKGELFMQILNVIHDEIEGEWMGVIHAASISSGQKAVMLPAQSGGGKSTLASLLMASGCQLLSDDFSPVALKNGQIHAFPGTISLKPGSLPLLSRYFPELQKAPESKSPSKNQTVKYLKPQQPDYLSEKSFQLGAIVFVKFNSQKNCELTRIPNLDALNDFLKESWIPNEARVAERFLDWFLGLPCYRLHYGDNQKAVRSILKLLEDVT